LLAERINREIPPGLSVQETKVQRGMHAAVIEQSNRVNRLVFIVTPIVLFALVGARIWLMWDAKQRRSRAMAVQ